MLKEGGGGFGDELVVRLEECVARSGKEREHKGAVGVMNRNFWEKFYMDGCGKSAARGV